MDLEVGKTYLVQGDYLSLQYDFMERLLAYVDENMVTVKSNGSGREYTLPKSFLSEIEL